MKKLINCIFPISFAPTIGIIVLLLRHAEIAHALPITNAPHVVPTPPPPPTNVIRPLITRSPLLVPPNVKTLTFTWDLTTNTLTWNLYLLGTINTLLGSVTTNQITVGGIDVTMTNMFAVSSSNAIGESALSVPLSASLPAAPANLHILQITP